MSMTTFNRERFAAILSKIKANPEEWDQSNWHSAKFNKGKGAGHGHVVLHITNANDLTTMKAEEKNLPFCGTAHCFAGHCQLSSGKEMFSAWAAQDALAWLEIPDEQFGAWLDENAYTAAGDVWLFAPHRKLEDFEDVLAGQRDLLTGKFATWP
jgi:hypothetical protein